MAAQDFSLQQLQPFLETHPGRGTLRVQVSTAQGAFPVPQAIVEVTAFLDTGRVLLYRKRADISGIADALVLPARPAEQSRQPGTAADSTTTYLVSVTRPGYESVTDLTAEVFTGTKTLLPVVLTPVTV